MTSLSALVTLCLALESTPGRLDKLRLVADFLRALGPDEAAGAVAFLTGRPFPASDPRVLGVRGLPPAGPAAGSSADARRRGRGLRRRRDGDRRRLAPRARGAADRAGRARDGPGAGAGSCADHQGRDAHGRVGWARAGGDRRAAGADPAAVRRAALVPRRPLARSPRSRAAGGAGGAGRRGAAALRAAAADAGRDRDRLWTRSLAAHGGRTALEYKYDGARIQLHSRRRPRGDLDAPAVRRHAAACPSRGQVARDELARRAVHPGRRGRGARRRRPAAAVPGADAALPPRARRGGARARDAARAALLRLPDRRRPLAHRRALRRALGGAGERHRRPLPRRAARRGHGGRRRRRSTPARWRPATRA